MSLDLLEKLALGGNDTLEGGLEVWLGSGIAASSEYTGDGLEEVSTLVPGAAGQTARSLP
jgi:hypothetical protein